MMTLPRNDNYSHSGTGDNPCALCARNVARKPSTAYLWYAPNSGTAYLPGVEAAQGRAIEDDTYGLWPIGPDCLRAHPELLPYVVKERIAQEGEGE